MHQHAAEKGINHSVYQLILLYRNLVQLLPFLLQPPINPVRQLPHTLPLSQLPNLLCFIFQNGRDGIETERALTL